MNRKKILIYLIVAIVLVAAAAVAVWFVNRPEEPEAEEERLVIFQTTEAELARVEIENPSDHYSFIKSDEGKFVPENAGDIAIASGKYDDLFINLYTIYADQLVEENAEDLAVYGLAEPQARVSLELVDGERKTFLLGNQTLLQTAYYFTEEGSGTVYTISTYRGNIFLRKLADLRDSPLPSVNPEYLASFELIVNGQTRMAASVDFESEAPGWQMHKPYERTINPGVVNEMILTPISELDLDNIEASQVEDLSPYGLSSPQATLIYQAKDEEPVTVHFGNTVGDEVYFRVGDGDMVYRYDKSILDIFSIDPVTLINRLGYLANIGDVSSILIECEGKVYDLAIDSEKNEYSVNGQPVEESPFKELYRTVMGMTISQDAAGTSTGNTFYTMTVSKKDGTQDVVKLEEVDGRRFRLNVNGEVQFLLLRTEIDTVLEALSAY